MADRVERDALRLSLKTAEAMVYCCGHPRGGCPNHCDLLVKVIHATRAALALPAPMADRVEEWDAKRLIEWAYINKSYEGFTCRWCQMANDHKTDCFVAAALDLPAEPQRQDDEIGDRDIGFMSVATGRVPQEMDGDKLHEIMEHHSTDVIDYHGAADDINAYLFGGVGPFARSGASATPAPSEPDMVCMATKESGLVKCACGKLFGNWDSWLKHAQEKRAGAL